MTKLLGPTEPADEVNPRVAYRDYLRQIWTGSDDGFQGSTGPAAQERSGLCPRPVRA